MKRTLITVFALAAVGLWAASAPAQPSTGVSLGGSGYVQTTINCEPVLIYDVTGNTLAGPVHMHLAVYSDGMSSIASSMELGGYRTEEVETTYVPMDRVARLVDELVAAGALDMVDQLDNVADLPMQTLTLLGSELVVVPAEVSSTSEIQGGFAYLQGKVNSFNYFLDIPRISPLVDAFISESF